MNPMFTIPSLSCPYDDQDDREQWSDEAVELRERFGEVSPTTKGSDDAEPE
jgi:hypothetical protein